MAFEPVYDYFKADFLKSIGAQQVSVNAKLRALNDEAVDRVLCVESTAVITAGEALSGEARYTGLVTFKAMYVSESGVQYASSEAEFSGKIEDVSITPKTVPQFTCRVMDTSADGSRQGEINASAAVEVMLSAVLPHEVKYLSSVSDGIYTREEETEFAHVTATARREVPVQAETEVKDLLKGVLLSSATSCVESAQAGLDCFVLEGAAYITVSYKTDADECAVKCVTFEAPFKEEIEAPGAMVGQKVSANCTVKGIKVTAEVDEETGRTKIYAEPDVLLTGVSYAEERVLTVSDAFSPDYNLGLTNASFGAETLADRVTGGEKVSGSFALGEGEEIDKLIGIASASACVTSAYQKDGKAVLEGIVTATALCSKDDKIKSIEIETPFTAQLPADAAAERVEAGAAVSKVTARHKKTDEIDFTAEVELFADLFRFVPGSVVEDVAVLGEKERAGAAMCVYVPRKNALLWDVAKELSVQPDLVMSQNPGLKFPLEGGERVLIYRQSRAKF